MRRFTSQRSSSQLFERLLMQKQAEPSCSLCSPEVAGHGDISHIIKLTLFSLGFKRVYILQRTLFSLSFSLFVCVCRWLNMSEPWKALALELASLSSLFSLHICTHVAISVRCAERVKTCSKNLCKGQCVMAPQHFDHTCTCRYRPRLKCSLVKSA